MLLSLATSGANVIEHFHGVPYEKSLRRLREYVEIVNLLVRGERLLYEGELFHLSRGFRLQVPRARDHIPIYIAAISPRSPSGMTTVVPKRARGSCSCAVAKLAATQTARQIRARIAHSTHRPTHQLRKAVVFCDGTRS